MRRAKLIGEIGIVSVILVAASLVSTAGRAGQSPQVAVALLRSVGSTVTPNPDGGWDVKLDYMFDIDLTSRSAFRLPPPHEIIDALNDLHDIRELTGTIYRISASDFRKLTCLANVTSIDLHGSYLDDSILPQLQQMTKIKRLKIHGNDRWLAALLDLKQLDELDVSSLQMSRAGLANLAQLPNLTKLKFGAKDDAHVEALPPLKSLTHLTVAGSVTDHCLASLERHPALRSLELKSTKVRLEQADALNGLARLRSLSLSQTDLRDVGASAIAKCERLSQLDVYHTKLTPLGVQEIAKLPRLRHLVLGCVREGISESSVDALASCSSLEDLNIAWTPLDDEQLMKLLALPKLHRIVVSGTKVTPAGLAKATAMRPDVTFQTKDTPSDLALPLLSDDEVRADGKK